MVTFLVSVVLLVIGYFTYGKLIESIFDPRRAEKHLLMQIAMV